MDAQVIIILLAIAFSIISAVSKNKKKKNAGAGTHQPPAETDDPWATIRKYIEDAQNGDDEPAYEEVHESRVEPVVQKVTTPETKKTGDPYVSSLNEYMLKKEREKIGKSERNKNKTVQRAVSPEPQHSIEESDVMDGFDLRKAIIYSEILKPKFDEV